MDPSLQVKVNFKSSFSESISASPNRALAIGLPAAGHIQHLFQR